MPPRRLLHPGDGDFSVAGSALHAALVERAGLTPADRVLDVGCGFGRLARPLADHLDAERGGAYTGFDVDAVAVGWCQARYPSHFAFVLADLYNARWHPRGGGRASDYRFPCDDGEVRVAALASVLTHLLEDEAAHYLAETGRVLAPGGRALLTLYVLDEHSRAAIEAERARLHFLQPDAHVAVLRDELPEDAVAYDADWLDARLREAGLRATDGLERGAWRGGGGPDRLPDLMVVEQCA